MKTKGFMKVIMLCATVMCLFSMNGKEAKADIMESIPLHKYEEIDNVPYPSLKHLHLFANKVRSYSTIKITEPGQLKMIVKAGFGVNGQGSAWVSRDNIGLEVVGTVRDITPKDGELSWFLDTGDYYVNILWSYGIVDVGVALLFEEGASDETQKVSTFTNTNKIELDKTFKGFLTYSTPNDYYEFVLDEKANVTIDYSFETQDNHFNDVGHAMLYDESNKLLYDSLYQNTDQGNLSYNHLLEPGRYIIKLNGLYGNTTIKVKPMYYNIELTAVDPTVWTKKTTKVNIKTTMEYSDIKVVREDANDTLINRKEYWSEENTLNVKVNGESFEATKNGIYSVRITDKFGNHSMAKIEITNVDTAKPKVTGVTNKKVYKKAVTIKFTDALSGINASKTKLNGKVITSGYTVKKEGEYTLNVTDKVGNVRKIVFTVDLEAPTSGIVNKKTYTSAVTLKFRDSISGIKKIVVNGEELDTSVKTRRYFLEGDYEVELWDNAGNYRKDIFYIK